MVEEYQSCKSNAPLDMEYDYNRTE